MLDQIIYIYKITNTINKKIYIGQTISPNNRWSQHKILAKNKRNYPLYNSMNKYGIDKFIFEIIERCEYRVNADLIEIKYIELYKSINREFGYNIQNGGNRSIHSEETKQKLSEMKTEFYKQRLIETGSKITEEERLNLVNSHLGHKPTEEALMKMSLSMLGKNTGPKSQETKDKISKTKKGNSPAWNKGLPNQNKGSVKFSIEQQLKICELYNSLTSIEIGKLFKCSGTTIIKVLRLNNISIKGY